MGDKSPKSKNKNQAQKDHKNQAADQAKKSQIASKQQERTAPPPPKKK